MMPLAVGPLGSAPATVGLPLTRTAPLAVCVVTVISNPGPPGPRRTHWQQSLPVASSSCRLPLSVLGHFKVCQLGP